MVRELKGQGEHLVKQLELSFDHVTRPVDNAVMDSWACCCETSPYSLPTSALCFRSQRSQVP